jgi:splicing factor U2AF subunit
VLQSVFTTPKFNVTVRDAEELIMRVEVTPEMMLHFHNSDTDVLEDGSVLVLVEFVRKEAGCMAAHSLHGRIFDDRDVSAGYAPHDLYLQTYTR